MSIIRALFGKKIVPGEIYIFEEHSKNPFKENPLIVEVIAVSNGYVNYRWVNSKLYQNESMQEDQFRFCYKRHLTPNAVDRADENR